MEIRDVRLLEKTLYDTGPQKDGFSASTAEFLKAALDLLLQET